MKVAIIMAILVPEADGEEDMELEAEILRELKTKIPWCAKIARVRVFSRSPETLTIP